jgi:hypothetical protein
MLTRTHIIFSSILSALLWPSIGWNALIVFFSGFLFDIDHWFTYIRHKKDYNLRRCHAFYRKLSLTRDFDSLHGFYLVFHSLEFFLLLAVSAVFSPFALFVFIGIVLHMALDYFDMWRTYKAIKVYHLPGFLKRRKTKHF